MHVLCGVCSSVSMELTLYIMFADADTASNFEPERNYK